MANTISLAQANEFVSRVHRHHDPVQGHKFSIACVDEQMHLRGVVIVGRPVSRDSDDGLTLEITRLATDGCDNACSFLYGVAARAAQALGYARIQTYILITEPGTSLKAAGWQRCNVTSGKSRVDRFLRNASLADNYVQDRKIRWERVVRGALRHDFSSDLTVLPVVAKSRPGYRGTSRHILRGRLKFVRGELHGCLDL